MKKTVTFLTVVVALTLYSTNVSSEFSNTNKYTLSEYIKIFEPIAIKEMNRSGVPASITLAQAILESGYGNSILALYANNHFGIKCKPDWKGETYSLGASCYKKYNNAIESYEDHSNHIKSRSWYSSLFNLKITDYKAWAHGLKKAGYAQDPYYAYRLIQIIDNYKFNKLDSLYDPSDTTFYQR
jgi:flagellum-specific peptidoglycan hydrolase FlgJ